MTQPPTLLSPLSMKRTAPLPARRSSLQTTKQHLPSSTIVHLHTLFKDNYQFDPLRCFQGWRLICEEEWGEKRGPGVDSPGGFNVMDINDEMKDWIGLVIKGIYLYDNDQDQEKETMNEKVEQTLKKTRTLLNIWLFLL